MTHGPGEVHARLLARQSDREPVVPEPLRYVLAVGIAGFSIYAFFFQPEAVADTREFAAAALGALLGAAIRGKG